MARKPSFPRRGSVYRVALDPAIGHELRKTRPAVVVSNNHLNELAETVLVMRPSGLSAANVGTNPMLGYTIGYSHGSR